MFREEIVCAGSEIVSTPSPWVDGDVLTVLASRDGRDRSSGQVRPETTRTSRSGASGRRGRDCWPSFFPALLLSGDCATSLSLVLSGTSL